MDSTDSITYQEIELYFGWVLLAINQDMNVHLGYLLCKCMVRSCIYYMYSLSRVFAPVVFES